MDKQKKTLLILAVLLGVALLGLLGAKKLAEKKEKADASMDSFLSFYIGITYLSYCIRDNPLKKKGLCAETW